MTALKKIVPERNLAGARSVRIEDATLAAPVSRPETSVDPCPEESP